MQDSKEVAIIGAGLTGLALSLSLHRQGIPATVYETRSEPSDIGGTILLGPNALRIVDALGLYEPVKTHGHASENVEYRTADDKHVDSTEYGSVRKYGYPAIRIYRHVLITAMLSEMQMAGIKVEYCRKFVRVIEETDSGVTWEFADGSTGQASGLVGTDGIHSQVRLYLYPGMKPIFTKTVAIAAYVPTTQIEMPNHYELPATIIGEKQGAYTLCPVNPDASELLIVKQTEIAERQREGWAELQKDDKWTVDFLQEGAEDFPAVVKTAVSHIPTDTIIVWPYYIVPNLERWVSQKSRVAILGDAAHAIPPATGQGANQCFEDAYTYALMLGRCPADALSKALLRWKAGRQERVDKLLQLAKDLNARRAPQQNGRAFTESDLGTEKFELDWLFKPDFDEMVTEWLQA